MNSKTFLKIFLTAAVLSAIQGRSMLEARTLDGTASERFYLDHLLLRDMVSEALERNPGLHASLARYRAALLKVPQAESLPDPVLSFTQYLRSPETRVGPQSSLTMLSQKFPWFGKLDLQGRIAASEAEALYQEYLAGERDLVARVKASFYEIYYLDRARGTLDEEHQLLDQYEKLSQARYSQGKGTQLQVIKIQAEITRNRDRLKQLVQQRETMAANLNTLLDRPPGQEIPRIGGLEHLPEVLLDIKSLTALGLDNRREVRASLDRIEKSDQAIALAKKAYWPDLTIGAGMANVEGREDPAGMALPPPDNGKNPFSISIGLNIPLWRDKYRSGVLEAAENRIAMQSEYARTVNEIEFSISSQAFRLQTLREQLDLYDSVLIAQAEEALRSAESSYAEGQGGILDLLDSERFLLNSRLIGERYRADYLKALAEMERALGSRFPVK